MEIPRLTGKSCKTPVFGKQIWLSKGIRMDQHQVKKKVAE